MQKILTPAQRLIVAADFKPTNERSLTESSKRNSVRSQVLTLAKVLKDTGVYLKVNSALRACGYDLIDQIHCYGLRVFADLKLYDVDDTLTADGILLAEAKPELLTVVCSTGDRAMRALKSMLPETEVLGVTILTSMYEEECAKMYGLASLPVTARMLAVKASDAGMDGVICAGTEAKSIRSHIRPEMSINTPAIRPAWAVVTGENQNLKRVMTPSEAIRAGATRIVVGKPITQAASPRDAVLRTLDEIAAAMN